MPKIGFRRLTLDPVLVLACVVGLAGAAYAQQPTSAQTSAIRSACGTDYRANCASVPPGGAASLACLQQNMAKLSPSCQKAVGAVGGAAAAPATPPATTAAPATAAPAAGAPPAASTAPAAMPPKTTPPKTTAKPAAPPPVALTPRQEVFIVRQTCGPDFRRLCGGVPLGGGRAIACLRGNAPYLSPACQGALMGR